MDKMERAAWHHRFARPAALGVVWLTWLCLFAASAQAATLSASVDRPTVVLGQTVTLSLVFDGAQVGQPTLPALPNFRVIGQGSAINMDISRGTSQQTFTYQLAPATAGDFTIPAMQFNAGGQIPIAVTVNTQTSAALSSATPSISATRPAMRWRRARSSSCSVAWWARLSSRLRSAGRMTGTSSFESERRERREGLRCARAGAWLAGRAARGASASPRLARIDPTTGAGRSSRGSRRSSVSRGSRSVDSCERRSAAMRSDTSAALGRLLGSTCSTSSSRRMKVGSMATRSCQTKRCSASRSSIAWQPVNITMAIKPSPHTSVAGSAPSNHEPASLHYPFVFE
mgnify:CR=1 FL=1